MKPFQVLQAVSAPLTLLIALSTLEIFVDGGVSGLFDLVEKLLIKMYQDYGVFPIFLISFVENIYIVNLYFPGAVVILTAMALTSGDPLLGVMMFFAIWSSSFIAQTLNFQAGKYWKEKSNNSTTKSNNSRGKTSISWLFFSTFMHPQLASITSFIAGREGISLSSFLYNALSIGFIWNCFWAISMYSFGNFVKEGNILLITMFSYAIIWLIWELKNHFKSNNIE